MRGKGTRLMVIADASGLPLALHTDSASPHEVTPVRATLDEIVTVGQPGRIVGDRAHDSDPPDNAPAAQGIGMMAPHRRNRKTQGNAGWSSLAALSSPPENRTASCLAQHVQADNGTPGQVPPARYRPCSFGIFHDFTQKSHQGIMK